MLRCMIPVLRHSLHWGVRNVPSSRLFSAALPKTVAPAEQLQQRIAKYLAACGAAPSRRAAERLIGEGRVTVDGVIVASPAITIAPSARVTVDARAVDATAAGRVSVFLMYKLAGELVSLSEPGRRTVFDRLAALGISSPLKAVGRLDMATEGLLVLTNSSALKRYLEHPSSRIPRVYRLRVYGHLVSGA